MVGVLMLLLAVRQWRNRPTLGEEPDMPKWMAGIDALAPGKALVFACCSPASIRRTSS